jgi:hypothetical protein
MFRKKFFQAGVEKKTGGSNENFPRLLNNNRGKFEFYISSTVMAPGSHTSMQLSHPRHSSALTGTDFPSWISNTSTGQTSTHASHP